MAEGMRILVTGGTGTLGQVLIPKILARQNPIKVKVLSRGEHTQMEMKDRLQDDRVEYLVGDIRDKDRVWYATRGIDQVYHLAAMKSVDKAEENPNEAISINVIGTQNIVDACIKNGVKKAIFTSTDKAVEPINIYGSTKLTAEKLFVCSNTYVGQGHTAFGCVRYGNVLASNGSVVQRWAKNIQEGKPIKITDPLMTRFWMTQDEAANFVFNAMQRLHRGEIFIPKMCSANMMTLKDCMSNIYRKAIYDETMGVRPGEKRHEVLISKEELPLVTDQGDFYIRWPQNPRYPVERRIGQAVGEPLTSHNAKRFGISELTFRIRWVLGMQ